MLSVLSDTTVTSAHVTSLLPVLPQTSRHFPLQLHKKIQISISKLQKLSIETCIQVTSQYK
ncbi:hypothetical protein Hanom_Chr05g00458941 [Helianthus anomalus]